MSFESVRNFAVNTLAEHRTQKQLRGIAPFVAEVIDSRSVSAQILNTIGVDSHPLTQLKEGVNDVSIELSTAIKNGNEPEIGRVSLLGSMIIADETRSLRLVTYTSARRLRDRFRSPAEYGNDAFPTISAVYRNIASKRQEFDEAKTAN